MDFVTHWPSGWLGYAAAVTGVLALISVVLYAAGNVVTWYWLARRRNARSTAAGGSPHALGTEPFSVSIFKPLSGVDDQLEENLESFANLRYGRLQILYCADDPNDPALDIARRIQRRHPDKDICILVSPGDTANRKISHFETMAERATGDLILLSDSNVRIGADDLTVLVEPFADPRVGLVYQPVVGRGEASWSAAIENLWLTEQAGMMVIALRGLLRIDAVNAKGMLCRRAALAGIGWFRAVRDLHNDDHILSEVLRAARWRIVMGNLPAVVIHRTWPLAQVLARHTRHAAGRFRLHRLAYACEIFGSPLAASLPCACLLGSRGAAMWGLLAVAKITLEVMTSSLLRRETVRVRDIVLIPIKDALTFYTWLVGPFRTRVEWRGRTYRIAARTRLEPLYDE